MSLLIQGSHLVVEHMHDREAERLKVQGCSQMIEKAFKCSLGWQGEWKTLSRNIGKQRNDIIPYFPLNSPSEQGGNV